MADSFKIMADFDGDNKLDLVWAGKTDTVNSNNLGPGMKNIDDSGTIKLTLKPATANEIGGVKIGEGLSVDGTGEISVTGVSLFDADDKDKLDGIDENANNYTHPETHPASIITTDETHMWITDTEKSKLAGIAPNANNYTHPETHSPDIIVETSLKQFITSAERQIIASFIPTGEVSEYVHPESHPASMIVEDTTHRWFTDSERTKLTGISAGAVKTASSATNGYVEIDGEDVKVYTHPANHTASQITESGSKQFVSSAQKTKLDAVRLEDSDFLALIQANYSNINLAYIYNTDKKLTSVNISGSVTGTITYTYAGKNLTSEVLSITAPYEKKVTINYTITNGLLTSEQRVIG